MVPLGPGAVLLTARALDGVPALLEALHAVAEAAPFRRMTVPGGHTMSVAMTSCGAAGWITDRRGYRYSATDPDSGRPWPAMPEPFRDLARAAAAEAGFPDFQPDTCLINRYEPGARMGLHQDRDERDTDAPIVSVSLGLAATFLWGGLLRNDPARRLPLRHGDVVVWGGPSRLQFHGIAPLREGEHPLTGRCRYNLTFRRAL
ncbi:DNA oxidative demethylase AlkB [Roseomonas elaeocarpi]|uniref:DNA oxidative demethylase AlkB n=1 Tax=Roseomonas elaeocarpi TaxID=907779 RepID=A0ABV6JX57_9PROT